MFVPFHDDGIISQFEGYEELEELDWEGYRARYGNIQRLDRILEAEGDSPNRYKAVEAGGRADALLPALARTSCGELFDRLGYPFEHDTIPTNIDYYLARTSHGSTLSKVVHAWVLVRSDRERAWSSSPRRSRATCSTSRAARLRRACTSAPWPERSTWSSAATRGWRPERRCCG